MIIKQVSPDIFMTTGFKRAWNYLKQSLSNKGHVVIKKGDKYDIVYANWVDPITYFRLKRIKDKPRILHVATTYGDLKGVVFFFDLFYNQILKFLKKYYLLGDRIITISEFAKQCIIKTGINEEKIDVVSCGVNLKEFNYSERKRKRFRKEYRIKKDEILILNVGLKCFKKGIDIFIKLAHEFPDVKFVWVGPEVPFKKNWFKIKRLIKQKPDNFLYTGRIEDVAAAYCGADIFLSPTRAEGEGMPILEAGACKRPIIARSIPPYKEKINNGKQGLLCNNNDEFIKAIKKLIKSRSLRKKMGLNAYQMAKKYDSKKTTSRIIKIIEEYT